jgi:hypothetical protein
MFTSLDTWRNVEPFVLKYASVPSFDRPYDEPPAFEKNWRQILGVPVEGVLQYVCCLRPKK